MNVVPVSSLALHRFVVIFHCGIADPVRCRAALAGLPLATARLEALRPPARVISSAGRALRLHRRCRGFESLITHHRPRTGVVFSAALALPKARPVSIPASLQPGSRLISLSCWSGCRAGTGRQAVAEPRTRAGRRSRGGRPLATRPDSVVARGAGLCRAPAPPAPKRRPISRPGPPTVVRNARSAHRSIGPSICRAAGGSPARRALDQLRPPGVSPPPRPSAAAAI